jgi:hypothetical protein
MQHTAPAGERFVRCENHGALVPVSVVDDVKQHVRGIGVPCVRWPTYVFPHARTAVGPPARLVRGPHQHAELAMASRMRRIRSALPAIEPAACHLQAAAQDRDSVRGLLRGDEPKPYRLCFAERRAQLA